MPDAHARRAEANRVDRTMKQDYSKHLDSPDEFKVQSAWWNGEENRALCDEIGKRLVPGKSVIDAGAGSGVGISYWLSHGAESVTAIDSSHTACAALRWLTSDPKVTVVMGDLREGLWQFSADTVICKAVLKHFGPEWRGVFTRLFDSAETTVIFTMNVAETAGDKNPDVPYYDWAEPLEAIHAAIPAGWTLVETFGGPEEPVFVCRRT